MWEEIGERLPSQLDTMRFRSVCKDWANCVPKPNPYPLNIPKPPPWATETEATNFPLFVTECTLFMLEQVDQGGKFRRFSFHSSKRESRVAAEVLDQRFLLSSLSFIYKSYHIPFFDQVTDARIHGCWTFTSPNQFVDKLVMLPVNYKNNNFDNYKNNNYVNFNINNINNNNKNCSNDNGKALVALMCGGGQLAMLSLGSVVKEWVKIENSAKFDDIICYKGKLWGVDSEGKGFMMMESLRMTLVAPPPPVNSGNSNDFEVLTRSRRQLVEASGCLYMLVPVLVTAKREGQKPKPDIRVYSLRFLGQGPCQWVEVESLGNHIFFVGVDFSFSVLADDIFRGTNLNNNNTSNDDNYNNYNNGIDNNNYGTRCVGGRLFVQQFSFCWLNNNDHPIHEKWFNSDKKINVSASCAEKGYSALPLILKNYSPNLAGHTSSTTTTLSAIVKEHESRHWCKWHSQINYFSSLRADRILSRK